MSSSTCKSLTFVLLCCALLAGCNRNEADRGGVVRGVVHDADGKPIAGAYVLVDGLSIQSQSDKEGRYALRDIPPGSYAVVAACPSYTPDVHHQVEIREGTRSQIDFTLQRDPNFVPDHIEVLDLNPAPGAVLIPDSEVMFRFRVRYHLSSAPYAAVTFTMVDDKGRSLLPFASVVNVTSADDVLPFARRVMVPERFDGKINLIVALIPGDADQASEVAKVTYSVRPYCDNVLLTGVTFTPSDVLIAGRQRIVTSQVQYVLDHFAAATVHVRVEAQDGDGKFDTLIGEASQAVNKVDTESVNIFVPLTVTPPLGTQSIRVHVELTPAGSNDVTADALSDEYKVYQPTPKQPSAPAPAVVPQRQ